MSDPQFTIEFITTAAPVQAQGIVAGHPFYFRARWNEWTFSISEDPDVYPVDLDYPEVGCYGFFRQGEYGAGKYSASYMPLAEAGEIMERCIREYLANRAA